MTSRINLAEITRDISLDPPQEVFLVESNSDKKTNITQVIPPTVRGNKQLYYNTIIYYNRGKAVHCSPWK